MLERRHQSRHEAVPILLEIGGTSFVAAIWSRGGALVESYGGPLTPGSLFAVTGLGLADEGRVGPVDIRARVARAEGEGRLAVQFLGIDRRAHAFFEEVLGSNPLDIDNPFKPPAPRFPPPPRPRLSLVR
ncbi:MAG: PilZ domain-containing protein [Magnetospirillum sp. WYHS-4]